MKSNRPIRLIRKTGPRIVYALVLAIGIVFSGSICATTEQLSPDINMSFEKFDVAGNQSQGLSAVEGIIGSALHFDGSSNCGIVAPTTGFSAPATVSVWVRISCPRSDYRLITRLDGDKDQIGTIRFQGCHIQVWNGDKWNELVPFIATNGSWQHLAIVFKEDGTATGYVNGREKLSTHCNFDFAGIKFGIGTGFKTTSGSAFAGDMDEFRIYHKALSSDAIKRLYSSKLFSRAEREDGTMLTELGKIALKESLEPIRPGIPGVRPFWNSQSRRFIYAPAFDFKVVEGAKCYKFTVTCSSDGSIAQFEADTPTAALSPIWTKITAGPVSLKVEGLNSPGGNVLGIAGTRDFIKSPAFNGPYTQRKCGYRECSMRSLSAEFNKPEIQNIIINGKPDSNNFIYASKFMGACAAGMAYYSTICPKHDEADKALKIARLSADFLISLNEKEGSPLAGWPPTYWNGTSPDGNKYSHDEFMACYPAEAAMAYLDLYNITHDAKYLAAAQTVADTYLRLQLKCGTWYQIYNAVTGEPIAQNLLVPTYVINLFDKIKQSCDITKYEDARKKAFNWIMANTMNTYNWQGQFEDVKAKAPYEDQSNQEVSEMSALLFRASNQHPEYIPMAKELLRFAEDQFVIWDRQDALANPNWATPSALEQYTCYRPIAGSNDSLIRAFIAGYAATSEPIYKAKAMALADTLTVAQYDSGGGEIPTYMDYGVPSYNWLNCSVYAAITLIKCDKL